MADPEVGPSQHPLVPPPSEQQDTPSNDETNGDTALGDSPGATFYMGYKLSASSVSRRLRGIHVFMITISGLLGVGLYIRSGSILRVGGLSAVVVSFTVIGFLAWMVMQCIGEMICIWPVSGALTVFVQTFVDEELGIAVGVAYWFTWSMSFAALTSATAGYLEIFFHDTDATAKHYVDGFVLFALIPFLIILINSRGVFTYGIIEVVGGILKILFITTVIIVFFVIIRKSDQRRASTIEARYTDPEEAVDWWNALCISLSIAAFAFVGIEIPAATAVEARVSGSYRTTRASAQHPQGSGTPQFLNSRSGNRGSVNPALKFSVTWLPFIATVVYVLAGLVLSVNLSPTDPNLPIESWINSGNGSTTAIHSTSGFVIATYENGQFGLAYTLTVFMIITAILTANTSLYVASRTLFGLTRSADVEKTDPLFVRFLAQFGRTNSHNVPLRALVASSFFIWVPLIYFDAHSSASVLEVLSDMASVSCVIVWFCQCWAFRNFYLLLQKYDKNIMDPKNKMKVRFLRRSHRGSDEDGIKYPYRSPGQPWTVYLAASGCFFILVLANGSSLWIGFFPVPFLKAYLPVILFILFWFVLKLWKNGRNTENWYKANFDDWDDFLIAVDKLDTLRDRDDNLNLQVTMDNELPDDEEDSWKNIFGLFTGPLSLSQRSKRGEDEFEMQSSGITGGVQGSSA